MKKILVIDDDEPILTMTKGMLEEEYHVTAVASGSEALELLENGYIPRLILLDLYMSDMGGWNTLFKIKELCEKNESLRYTHVVLYTSSEDPGDMEKAEMFGAIDYIHKPVSRYQLLDKVAKLVTIEPF